jgi:hypothetical protein
LMKCLKGTDKFNMQIGAFSFELVHPCLMYHQEINKIDEMFSNTKQSIMKLLVNIVTSFVHRVDVTLDAMHPRSQTY